MPPQELIEYIQKSLQANIPQETIVNNLLAAHWKYEHIAAAFATLGMPITGVTANTKTPWYNVPGHTGVLNWKALLLLNFIPFFVPVYFIYLIVISISRHNFKLFKEGFWHLLLAWLVLLLVGFGVCALILLNLN